MPTLDAYIHGAWTKITLPEVSTGPVPPGSGAHPEHPIVLPPGPDDPRPSHPIVIPPGFIDGVHPEHPIVIVPPRPPGVPTHPIVIPPDLGIWPNPPEGQAPLPSHPIVIPPPTVTDPPRPAHPIVLPDPPTDGGPSEPPQVMDNWDVVTYWTLEGGWAVAIVPSPSNPGVPTPSGGS